MPPRDDDIHLPPEDERAGLRELHDPAPSPRRGLVLLASAGAVTLGLAAVVIAAYTRPPAAPEEPTVIAAPASPIKTRPDNPGGDVVRNQDLHVNALMERPAPLPAPTARPSQPAPAATPAAETIRLAEPAPPPAPSPATAPHANPGASANPGATATQSLRIVVRDPETETAVAPPAPAPSAPAPAAAPAASSPPPTVAPTGPARAASAPPQGVRVQIGAFRTAAAAETGWAQFSRKHPAMARDRNKVVTRVTVEGTEWRRLQITGFADRTAAEAYCSALRPTGQACMVVAP